MSAADRESERHFYSINDPFPLRSSFLFAHAKSSSSFNHGVNIGMHISLPDPSSSAGHKAQLLVSQAVKNENL